MRGGQTISKMLDGQVGQGAFSAADMAQNALHGAEVNRRLAKGIRPCLGRGMMTEVTGPNPTGPNPTGPRSTQASLPMALLRAREAVMARFRPILDAHDINEQQWRVIRVLAEHDSLDATELAARANILAPSLTRMIRALAARGLIRRGKDKGDGRRVILSITDDGRRLIAAVTPHSVEAYARIDAEFGPERVAALIALLDALSLLPAPGDG